MLITNILTNQTPLAPPPEDEGAQTETQTGTTETEEPQAETTQAGNTSKTEKGASVVPAAEGGTQRVTITDVGPRLTLAMDEAFARAAALRTLEGVRTRALIDMISPIDGSGAKAAKSYLSLIEPKEAAQANGESKTPRKTAPLDRAA